MPNELNFDALGQAIVALEDGLREYEQYPHLLTVRDGVIQRFESAMDLARKLILRALKERFDLDDLTANNKTFIREGAKYGLIADAEAWMEHLGARNQTSHAYDAAIANRVFSHVPYFLTDVRDLFKKLQDVAA